MLYNQHDCKMDKFFLKDSFIDATPIKKKIGDNVTLNQDFATSR